MLSTWRGCLAGLLFWSLCATPAVAEVRALIWANDYSNAGNSELTLRNTLIDARAVAAMLQRLGIADVRVTENPSADGWNAELDALAQRLRADDVALLYYAGHALQVNGSNYFLAADGTTLVSSDEVLSAVMAKARGTVFLVDACRDNPFREQSAGRDRQLQIGAPPPAGTAGRGSSRALRSISLTELARAGNGLGQMGNLRGKNSIVLFSTDPGNVAVDGDAGRGSPFANAVVRELSRRQSLDAAIRGIVTAVDKETSGRQSPWRQGDLTFPLFLAGQPRFPVP
jgi:uncharacterized caspase-like protein